MITQTALIILAVVIVGVLVSRRGRNRFMEMYERALESREKKRTNLEKIVRMLEEGNELSNTDIRESLGVSDRTATRYMNILEDEGRVEQVGTTGRSVTYRVKA